MPTAKELAPDRLRRVCDPASLPFETTANLPALTEVLGQPRAVAALEMGASIPSHGFNIFALGQPGSGKTTLIRNYLQGRAASQPVPPDLCYVNNFANPRSPVPLRLPAGRAARLERDIASLVDELRSAIPKAFDAPEYSEQRDKVMREMEQRRQAIFTELQHHVTQSGFQVVKGPTGLFVVPAVGEKLLTEQDLEQLKPEEKEKVHRVQQRLQRELEERFRAAREIEKGARDAIRALDAETAAFATRHLIDDVRARYRDLPEVDAWLETFQSDVIEHFDDFRGGKEQEGMPPNFLQALVGPDRSFVRYQVNVLVDNSELKGAPVVVETNPTYHNLIGRIEHQSAFGGVFTDHTMLKAGALHRANGGYLVIPAREILINPFAWESLKRALKDRSVDIEELGAQLSLVSTVTLDPQPVPLDLKVVLIGAPLIYYLLSAYDEDFQKLFKVKAEFTTYMERTPETEQACARFISTIAREENALPFDRGAVARLIEIGSRAVEMQNQISTRFGDMADLVREAAHLASQNSHEAVTAADIRAVEQARRFRHNLIEQRMQEAIERGVVLLDTEGTAAGRVNGLSVLSLGDYAFGHPSRISATVGPGRGGVVSIEREVELSGPIHGKGVMILAGYLLRRYAGDGPLSLSASLVFEQSYGLVEGDSASMAELCALLSAISGVPLRQDIAMTGSVNQHGGMQAIGGVNEKIEGFFDVCRVRGLTGSQGVLIPESNAINLMLRDDVVEAVRAGLFHVWTAASVDEAIELLTGQPCEQVHDAVGRQLSRYAELLRAMNPPPEAGAARAS